MVAQNHTALMDAQNTLMGSITLIRKKYFHIGVPTME